MLYPLLRSGLLRLLRAPSEPPEAPAGSHASVRVFRASPRFLSYRLLVLRLFLGLVLAVLVALAAAALVQREEGILGLALLVAVLALPAVLLAGFLVRVDYDLRYYLVTDRSMRVREGAWTVREMTITYANVQNLRVVQGPLMRLYGIWDLRIDVAGGGSRPKQSQQEGGHHVTVAGIEDAHALRDQVLTHLRASRAGSGLGDPDDAETAPRGRLGVDALGALERVAVSAGALAAAARARAGLQGG